MIGRFSHLTTSCISKRYLIRMYLSYPEVTDFVFERHNEFNVLRDDKFPGGTKGKILNKILFRIPESEIIYSTCQYGEGYVALAESCLKYNKRLTLIVPNYDFYLKRFISVSKLPFVKVIVTNSERQIDTVNLAQDYAKNSNGFMIPVGFDFELFFDKLIEYMLSLQINPKEIWTLAGSGTLLKALIQAFPNSKINAVSLGLREFQYSDVNVYFTPEKLNEKAKYLPPFKSNVYYDAKVWRFACMHGTPDALIWNVS